MPRPLAVLVLAALAAGCVSPAAAPAHERHLVARLGLEAEHEAAWSAEDVAAAFVALGFEVAWQGEESVGTPITGKLAYRAHRDERGAWRLAAERTVWRVEACSQTDLDAWTAAAHADLGPGFEAALRDLEDALGVGPAERLEPATHVRSSDASWPLAFTRRCSGAEAPSDGFVVDWG